MKIYRVELDIRVGTRGKTRKKIIYTKARLLGGHGSFAVETRYGMLNPPSVISRMEAQSTYIQAELSEKEARPQTCSISNTQYYE